METLREIFAFLPFFCFAYPFIMAWYWMAGGLFYYFWRERGFVAPDELPPLDEWPPFSILVPCFNESETAVETLTTAHKIDYPDFEIIAINDGSSDDTAEILDRLAQSLPRLRVIHLVTNGGKARALNVGARLARNELLLCIDGDALLDPHALRWAAYNFLRTDVGVFTGNPRIRNRTTVAWPGAGRGILLRSSASSSARRQPMDGSSPFRASSQASGARHCRTPAGGPRTR